MLVVVSRSFLTRILSLLQNKRSFLGGLVQLDEQHDSFLGCQGSVNRQRRPCRLPYSTTSPFLWYVAVFSKQNKITSHPI